MNRSEGYEKIINIQDLAALIAVNHFKTEKKLVLFLRKKAIKPFVMNVERYLQMNSIQ